MTDRILLVTPPDDILLDSIRITHLQLTDEQSSMISTALMNSTLPHTIVNYVWKMGDRVDWLLDKIAKSDLVFFDADSPNNGAIELILGWTAAQPQSYYFGRLRDLHLANDRAIYTSDDILILLEKISRNYEQI